jgi:histidyl-tRNA synthetase
MGKEIRFRAARGVRDILPGETGRWQFVERVFREVFDLYGYEEIRVPIFEETALFARGLGDTTDIVEKEMYTFPDKSGHSLTLRPEGTAPVVRAYLERGLDKLPGPVKLSYQGPMFRYERPQKGRFRQFHQIGCEFFGAAGPEADAELLEMVHAAFLRLAIPGLRLQINSLGDADCRPRYREALLGHLRPLAGGLCENCQRRLETNPLRVLDCKAASCVEARQGAPQIGEHLCDPCSEHFDQVKAYLDEWKVPYEVNAEMVRGLDYYTRTTFELTAEGLGSQDAVAAGGRYDGLVESFGGPVTPGLGFALGMERLILILPESRDESDSAGPVFFAALGDEARRLAMGWVTELRRLGVRADLDYDGRSLKSQMRRADRTGARHVVLMGEEELGRGRIIIRNMKTKEQEEVTVNRAVDRVRYYAQKG